MRILRGVGIPFVFLMGYFMLALIGSDFLGLDSVFLAFILDIIFIFVCGFYLYHNKYFGKSSFKANQTLVGVLCIMFFVIWFYGQITGALIFRVVGDASFLDYQKVVDTRPVMSIFLVLFVAPVMEELFFRGIIYGTMRKYLNAWVALFVSAFLFSVTHGTLVHLFGTFVFGLFAAIIMDLTNSIKWPILIHFGYNFLTLILGNMRVTGILVSSITVILVDMTLVVVLLVLFKYVLDKKDNCLANSDKGLDKIC